MYQKIKLSIIVLITLLSSTKSIEDAYIKDYSYKVKSKVKYSRVQQEAEVQVKFTYYWIATEAEFPIKSGSSGVDLKSCIGNVLKKVSKEYHEQVKMEGSGYLSNGQFVNCGDDTCNCFEIVDSAKGSQHNSLNPYTSIAANDIAFGMTLFVKELNGTILPFTNQTHNGCVRVDDKSWSFNDNHIDWYVFNHRFYEKIDSSLRLEKATIRLNAPCQLLNYSVPLNTSIPSSASKRRPPYYYSIPLVSLLLPFY